MSELEDFGDEFMPLSKDRPYNPKLLCSQQAGAGPKSHCVRVATVIIGGKQYCAFHAPKPKPRH